MHSSASGPAVGTEAQQPFGSPGLLDSPAVPLPGQAGCPPLGDVGKTEGAAGDWLPEDTLGWVRGEGTPSTHSPNSLEEAQCQQMGRHGSQTPAQSARSAPLCWSSPATADLCHDWGLLPLPLPPSAHGPSSSLFLLIRCIG